MQRKLSIHLASDVALEINRRVIPGRGPSATGAQAIARYAELCARSDPGLTDSELGTLARILAGWEFHSRAIELLHEIAIGAAKQAKQRLAPGLVAKLRGLSYAQRLALVDRLERDRADGTE